MQNQYYPRWIVSSDGASRMVPNREQHEAHVGYPVNEDGTPKLISPYPLPPTVAEIIDAGYSQESAEKIFAQEQERAAKGLNPYGPNNDAPAPEMPANDPDHPQVDPEFAAELEASLEKEISGKAIAETIAGAEEKAALMSTAEATAKPRRGRPPKVAPVVGDDPGSFA